MPEWKEIYSKTISGRLFPLPLFSEHYWQFIVDFGGQVGLFKSQTQESLQTFYNIIKKQKSWKYS